MYGGTTADAVGLAGALKGNNTMLDNYGMAANDALIKTKALEWASTLVRGKWISPETGCYPCVDGAIWSCARTSRTRSRRFFRRNAGICY